MDMCWLFECHKITEIVLFFFVWLFVLESKLWICQAWSKDHGAQGRHDFPNQKDEQEACIRTPPPEYSTRLRF